MVARLPERVRTPAVARAVVSPGAFLAAGAAASAAILVGAPLVAAAVAGALGWAARVAFAIPRRPPGTRIDPFTVGEPWRRFVQDAQDAQRRFQRTVQNARTGPLRERMETIGRRIEQGVTECWRIARQGHTLEGGLRQLDVRVIDRELAELHEERRRYGEGDPAAASLDRAEQALLAQRASYDRLYAVWRDAQTRLRVLNAQLDEAVARAVELSVGTADESALSPVGADVENVVHELEALRQAMEETSVTGPAAAGETA